MCRRVSCGKCGRPTFAGCGAHVEQVLRDVPKADRCNCHEAKSQEAPQTGATGSSWVERLFGKG